MFNEKVYKIVSSYTEIANLGPYMGMIVFLDINYIWVY